MATVWAAAAALAILLLPWIGSAERGAAAPASSVHTIRHLEAGANGKFSLRAGSKVIGGLGYSRQGNVVSLDHTVIDPPYRGQGLAKTLVKHAVGWARQNGIKLVPACSFAQAEFLRNPQYGDVVAR